MAYDTFYPTKCCKAGRIETRDLQMVRWAKASNEPSIAA